MILERKTTQPTMEEVLCHHQKGLLHIDTK